ncbi:DUF6443 domain-containing protein [Pinibacter aurantiacus]|uniref:DUF6443 domain-containing protein n=1 Tax=Pinibacter aurantiacus TaxID=2851599 RepID=A0A9E2W3Z6_9BACT|nr:DUF6443 domain-containing protein [Pinibacter aurantiacus]MBV4359100.1 hypothetical protein [Pinibacter aurantiacus]
MRNNIFLVLFISLFLQFTNSIKAYNQTITPSPYSASTPVNSIKVWETSAPEKNEGTLTVRPLTDIKQSAKYYDGLGRPIQSVAKQGSMITGQQPVDMVSPYVYDMYGREAYRYLPFAANNTGANTSISDGLFKNNPFQQDSTFNKSQFGGQGETYYYGKSNYEISPLSRLQEVYAPGNSWVGSEANATDSLRRRIQKKYWLNTASDSVRVWTVTNSGALGQFGSYASAGFYSAGQLYKNGTIDQLGNQVLEFKDKEGRLILKKVLLSAGAKDLDGAGHGYSGWLNTYYVYDDVGNLRCIIQPKGVELLIASSWNIAALGGDILNEQCFRFEYDQRRRMIVKQVPGAGPKYMIYDTRDRLVMQQDSLQRQQGKWFVTVYDNFNRAIKEGLWTNAQSFFAHKVYADTSYNYPTSTSLASNFELLEITHYDDYTSLPSGLSASLINSGYSSYFLSASNSIYPYAQPISASLHTKGLVTWFQQKVLGSSNQYISTANIYDDKGELIQTQTINQTNGLDVFTTQHSWAGSVLVTHLKHNFIGTKNQTYEVVTKNNYDALGRLTSIDKNINAKGWRKIDSLQYDALGQVNKKILSPAYNNNTGLESVTDEYNIRGWLLGSNRNYVSGSSNNFFGFDVGYDKNGTQTFAGKQYNGNTAGTAWKSAGDGVVRKYDFSYDAANRLLKAGFTDTKGYDYSVQLGDGINAQSAYDANGNILSMKQRGLKGGMSATIDSLVYGYVANSNKLKIISDGANDEQTTLGDFHYIAANKGAVDYAYDGNGNMLSDKNKAIANIKYNHLSLPDSITVTAKGTIKYVYDAGGIKLQKITTDTTLHKKIVTTTNYLDGFVYQSRVTTPSDSTDYSDSLQLISYEEGRIRKLDTARFVYDYFIKDQLGDVRMVLTEQSDTIKLPTATLEPPTLSKEKFFYAINDGQITDTSLINGARSYPQFQSKAYRINGSTDASKAGLGIVLKVMAGDKVTFSVQSIYTATGTLSNPATATITDLLSSFLGSGAMAGKGLTATALDGLSPGSLPAFQSQHSEAGDRPKAYLNYLLFDDQFRYVAGDLDPVNTFTANTPSYKLHNKFITAPVNVTKNGYIYIYVSNESNLNVFFDNLTVTHMPGPLMEESHYYPFGLTMSGISSKAGKVSENKYKFLDKELQNHEFGDGSGLEDYDFGARFFDPQLGRFFNEDPLAEYMPRHSPYTYSFDNPLRFTDPGGMVADDLTADGKDPLTIDSEVKRDYEPTKDRKHRAQVLPVVVVTGKKKKESLLGKIADVMPFIGGGKKLYEGVRDGNILKAGLGILIIGVDAVTFGEGGELLNLGEKALEEGAELLVKDEIEETAEKELAEQIGEDAAKEEEKAATKETEETVEKETSKKEGSSKNEKHGDGGRAKSKAEKQIEKLKEDLKNTVNRRDKQKIEQKIKNITKDAAQKAKGQEHSRIGKR